MVSPIYKTKVPVGSCAGAVCALTKVAGLFRMACGNMIPATKASTADIPPDVFAATINDKFIVTVTATPSTDPTMVTNGSAREPGMYFALVTTYV
jgi:hypothetical protein